jgi:dihydromethanopterin reductase (acceptor)
MPEFMVRPIKARRLPPFVTVRISAFWLKSFSRSIGWNPLPMAKVKTPRWGWALTGSGHFFKECLRMIGELDDVDLFVSRAASEVVRMYRQEFKLPKSARVFRDTTASAAPVGLFYYGVYHTVILAPATSNTVAKCVFGISDTLVTNVFAQAGKCRVPAIVFACDTVPELETEAPKGMVKVYPREIDLQNTERLRSFNATLVVETLEQLATALTRRKHELHG